MYWAQNIRLRTSSAFGGTAMPRASSTVRTEASACTVVQTPQARSAEGPGVARVAALEDHLEAADHGAGAVGVDDLAVLDLDLDAEVPFDAGDRVDDDAVGHVTSLPCAAGSSATSSLLSISSWISLPLADVGGDGVGGDAAAAATPAATRPTLSAVVSMPKPGNDGRCR